MRSYLLKSLAAAALMLTAVEAQAQERSTVRRCAEGTRCDRVEDRRDRREDVRDRREDVRDRREDVRDRAENRAERRRESRPRR